jgi:hypothetical protein
LAQWAQSEILIGVFGIRRIQNVLLNGAEEHMSDFKTCAKDVRRMYSDLAWLFPVISPVVAYEDEADELWRTVERHSLIAVTSLFIMGSGAGHLDYHLKKKARITGIDCSADMTAIARSLNPESEYHIGDMRTARLSARFEAVLIADALPYLLTEQDLREAFTTAYEHLLPGGVFVTYLEAYNDKKVMNGVRHSTYPHNGSTVTHIEHYFDPDPADNTYEMTFFNIIRHNGLQTVEVDHHLGGIFPIATYRGLLEDVGFEVTEAFLEAREVPMFVGLKRNG